MSERRPICVHEGCNETARVKGLCKRHYMREYNRRYWGRNKADITAFRKKYRRSKQSA